MFVLNYLCPKPFSEGGRGGEIRGKGFEIFVTHTKKHTSSRTKLRTHAHITYATAKPKRFCRKKTEGPSVCKVYRKYCVCFFSPCLHGKVFFTTERGFLFTCESGAFLTDVARVVWFVAGMVSSPPALRRVLKMGYSNVRISEPCVFLMSLLPDADVNGEFYRLYIRADRKTGIVPRDPFGLGRRFRTRRLLCLTA